MAVRVHLRQGLSENAPFSLLWHLASNSIRDPRRELIGVVEQPNTARNSGMAENPNKSMSSLWDSHIEIVPTRSAADRSKNGSLHWYQCDSCSALLIRRRVKTNS